MGSSSRSVAVLIATNVLGGVGVASGIAVGALLVGSIGGTSLAGFGQAISVLGSAVAAVPLARVAATHSRRRALLLGYLAAALGAVIVMVAALADALIPLLAGLGLFGVATAAGLQTRYAASDVADPNKRGRTLSLVVWATTIGSVTGPNLSTLGAELGSTVGLPELAGPYLFSVVGFALAAIVVGVFLPVPRAADAPTADHGATSAGAQRAPGHNRAGHNSAGHTTPGNNSPDHNRPGRNRSGNNRSHHNRTASPTRPVSARTAINWALRHPIARFALVLIAVAHAVMVGVMSMTPLHIEDHGHGLRLVGIVISLHILGMYALSPVFGLIADRWGAMPVAFGALVTLAAALAMGATAGSTGNMTLTTAALITLGLGWSMALISSSALFAGVDSGEVRVPLQGATDALMSYAGAAAALLGGPLIALISYAGLNLAAAALLVPALGLGLVALRTRPAQPSG